MQNWQDTSKNTKDESCSGRTTSKIETDKQQYSQNMVGQLRRWQWQNFWTSTTKLPGMAGEVSDALLSAHDAPRLLRLPEADCPEIWIRIHPRPWPKSWDDPVVSLGRNLHRHPLSGLLRKRKSEEVQLQKQMGEPSNMGMSFRCIESSGCSYRSTLDDIKMVGKSRPSNPCGTFCQRNWRWRTHAFDRPSVFGMHAERNKGGLSSSSSQNWVVQNMDSYKWIWTKIYCKRKQSVKTHHCSN